MKNRPVNHYTNAIDGKTVLRDGKGWTGMKRGEKRLGAVKNCNSQSIAVLQELVGLIPFRNYEETTQPYFFLVTKSNSRKITEPYWSYTNENIKLNNFQPGESFQEILSCLLTYQLQCLVLETNC